MCLVIGAGSGRERGAGRTPASTLVFLKTMTARKLCLQTWETSAKSKVYIKPPGLP